MTTSLSPTSSTVPFVFPYTFLCLLFSHTLPPPPLSLFPLLLLLISLPSSHFPLLFLLPSLPFLPPPLSLSPTPPSHSSQESDAQAVSTEVGQLDLLEAGPAEDGSEQAEQVRLFLAGEHDIMQKVFAGQEEEEERGTQVEIEVRTFCIKETVH